MKMHQYKYTVCSKKIQRNLITNKDSKIIAPEFNTHAAVHSKYEWMKIYTISLRIIQIAICKICLTLQQFPENHEVERI